MCIRDRRYAGAAQIVVCASPAHIAITVQDRGPGIPEEALDLVFEPFYRQEDSRNVASGGVGLGLSIARDIAAAHHGTLWLRNRSGGGLEADLRLPRAGCRT